jgi:hypothetical protein
MVNWLSESWQSEQHLDSAAPAPSSRSELHSSRVKSVRENPRAEIPANSPIAIAISVQRTDGWVAGMIRTCLSTHLGEWPFRPKHGNSKRLAGMFAVTRCVRHQIPPINQRRKRHRSNLNSDFQSFGTDACRSRTRRMWIPH